MKLIGYTCTYNEEMMIPYVMPYVERLGYDKFIVYDNMSTDRTVELLKEYPFVEIREYDTNGKFDDYSKLCIQLDAFAECSEIAKIGTDEEEPVWMTFTDFDEVLYCNDEWGIMLKISLEEGSKNGCNYFNDRMINLIPPKNMENISLSDKLVDKQLVHSIDGIRGKFWTFWGCKPVLIYVNDIYYYEPSIGNHTVQLITNNDKPLKSINDMYGNILTCFHLKWIDKNILLNKSIEYIDRGNEMYKSMSNTSKIDDIYMNILYPSSFPIEMYFYDNFNGKYNSIFKK